MARIKNTVEEQAPEVTATEAVEVTEPTEQVESGTENTEPTEQTEASAAKADEPIDTTSFESALNTAIENADESTGVLPTEQVSLVQEAYRALDGTKAKAAARKIVDERMRLAVDEDDILKARIYLTLTKELTAGKAKSGPKEKVERKPADPTEAFVAAAATLDLARVLVSANKPEGLAEDADAQVEQKYNELYEAAAKYLEWTNADKDSRGDEPEVDAIAKAAARLATGKKVKAGRSGGGTRVGATYTGPRRSPLAHIVEVFENQEVGAELKISEIVNTKTSVYESGEASPGALSNALKNKAEELLKHGIEGKFGRPVSAVKVS